MGQPARHVDPSTARKAAGTIREAITAHLKVCATCYHYRPNATRYCPEGYELSKQLAMAKDDIRRLTPASLGGPATLF